MVMIYQSFARSKKIIGWPYGDSLTTFDRGIINLYRRKSDLEKYLAYFLKLKDKPKFLKQIEERVMSFKIGRDKEFGALYGRFLDFWPLANLPLALDNALRILKYKKTLAKYKLQLVRLRRLSADKMVCLEKLIDRSVRSSRLYAMPDEILKNKVDQEKLKKRKRAVLILEKNKVKIVTGGRAATWFKIFTEVIEAPTVAITGRSAYPGKIKGRVRMVIYKKDLEKIKKGDILVTPMTEPDFLAYLKKAAAIITDEGGITSHAVIVARELKKPCIVGTKNATKILKNGQIIEVDANKGIVREVK
jgi:phosphoenolpyruvate synthase/pyruvate phosphate dikinase